MGFDAGSIIAYLKLDKTDFDDGLAAAQAEAKALEGKVITVPVDANTKAFDSSMSGVQTSKAAAAKSVTTEVDANAAPFVRSAAAVVAEKAVLEKPVKIPVELDVKETSSVASSSMSGLDRLKSMGFSSSDILSGLSTMGLSSESIKSSFSKFLVGAILPSQAQMKSDLAAGVYSLIGSVLTGAKGGGTSEAGGAYSFTGGFEKVIMQSAGGIAADLLGGQSALPSGVRTGDPLALPAGSLSWMTAGNPARAYAMAGGAITDPYSGGVPGAYSTPWFPGQGEKTITDPFPSWAQNLAGEQFQLGSGAGTFGTGNNLPVLFKSPSQRVLEDLFASGDLGGGSGLTANSLLGDLGKGSKLSSTLYNLGAWSAGLGGGGKGGGIANIFRTLGGASDSASAGLSSALPGFLNTGTLAASLPATPLLGAFGAASGGMLAGSMIGGAGLGAYGMLASGAVSDLSAAYSAQQQLKSGQITQAQYQQLVGGLTPAAVTAMNGGLGNTFSSINNNTIHPLQNQIVGQVSGVVGAVGKAMPTITPFLQAATTAMGGFWKAIDKGLGSGGFKSFMADMTRLVGPIIRDFGTTFLNGGRAVGGFLKVFGELAAGPVGKWFVRISGEFADFMSHLKLGPGFVGGMTTAFNDLGKILDPVIRFIKGFADAAAPIGFIVLGIAGHIAQLLNPLAKLLASPLGPWILGAGAAFLSFGKAVSLVKGIFSMIELALSPTGLIVIGLVAVAAGAYELATHWHTVWSHIKEWADDAWHFLDDLFHNKIVQGILAVVSPLTFLALHWQTTWNDIKTAANVVWSFLENDVIHPLINIFGTPMTSVIDAFRRAWDVVWGAVKSTVVSVWDFLKPIFSTISSGISGIVNGIGKVASIAGKVTGGVSSVVSALNPTHWFATGGPVAAGQTIGVGENGPELFQPSTAGTIIPNNRLGGYGSSQPVQLTVYVDARNSQGQAAVEHAARSGVQATFPALQSALARGAQAA